MSGIKNDSGKPDLTLVSKELMVSLARVREFGTKKYSRDNWKKGFKVTRSLAASLRHIFAFLSGETLDPESGLSHLGHAVASIEHAMYDMEHHPENDDRSEPELVEAIKKPSFSVGDKVRVTRGPHKASRGIIEKLNNTHEPLAYVLFEDGWLQWVRIEHLVFDIKRRFAV